MYLATLTISNACPLCTRSSKDSFVTNSGDLFRRIANVGGGASGFGLCLGVRNSFGVG